MSTRRLRKLGAPRVLVAGDLILDHYVFGVVERISPEAPIQVLDSRREEYRIGGAGNVAAGLLALGARATCLGSVGTDPSGRKLRDLMVARGIATDGLIEDSARPTTTKSRMVAHDQQILRLDREDRRPVGPAIVERAARFIEASVAGFEAVVVSDYAKGFLVPGILSLLIDRARAAGRPVLVDPKGRDLSRYRRATLITPNRKEAEEALGEALDTDEALEGGAKRLIEENELQAAVITLGKDGIFFADRSGGAARIPTRARAVYDVTGAGDTVLAVLAASIASGMKLEDAVRLANVAGGIAVRKIGAAQVSRAEIGDELRAAPGEGESKVVTLDELGDAVARRRAEGLRIVMTNGCFDILHRGHVETLAFARVQGDLLVVALNSDRSVRSIKGRGRPIVGEADRAAVLSALAAVDYVVLFDEDDPLQVVRRLVPDVLVKGDDWRGKEVAGADLVEAAGGRVVFAPTIPGLSTTEIAASLERGS